MQFSQPKCQKIAASPAQHREGSSLWRSRTRKSVDSGTPDSAEERGELPDWKQGDTIKVYKLNVDITQTYSPQRRLAMRLMFTSQETGEFLSRETNQSKRNVYVKWQFRVSLMKLIGPAQSHSGENHQSPNPTHMYRASKCLSFSLSVLGHQGPPHIWENPLTWVTETKTNHRKNLEN